MEAATQNYSRNLQNQAGQQAAIAGALAPAETPEIRSQIHRTASQLAELRGMAEVLRERLEPAMRPSLPQPASERGMDKAMRSKSSYADQIDGLRSEVQDVMSILGDCLNRLET